MPGDTPTTAMAAFGRFVDSIISSLTQKQEVLVSGDNIKTLNGETILGQGNVLLKPGYVEDIEVMSGSVFDLSLASVKKKVLDANTTFTFDGIVYGKCNRFILYLENADTFTVSLPASVKWMPSTPIFTSKDRIVFETIDDGTTWLAFYTGSYE